MSSLLFTLSEKEIDLFTKLGFECLEHEPIVLYTMAGITCFKQNRNDSLANAVRRAWNRFDLNAVSKNPILRNSAEWDKLIEFEE